MGAVVGAAVGDVDRDVAEEEHAALARVVAQRVPFALEANLVLERAAVVEPVVDPVGVPRAELRRVGAGDGRLAVGDQLRRARERGG